MSKFDKAMEQVRSSTVTAKFVKTKGDAMSEIPKRNSCKKADACKIDDAMCPLECGMYETVSESILDNWRLSFAYEWFEFRDLNENHCYRQEDVEALLQAKCDEIADKLEEVSENGLSLLVLNENVDILIEELRSR